MISLMTSRVLCSRSNLFSSFSASDLTGASGVFDDEDAYHRQHSACPGFGRYRASMAGPLLVTKSRRKQRTDADGSNAAAISRHQSILSSTCVAAIG
jgi:hypothetical protein